MRVGMCCAHDFVPVHLHKLCNCIWIVSMRACSCTMCEGKTARNKRLKSLQVQSSRGMRNEEKVSSHYARKALLHAE